MHRLAIALGITALAIAVPLAQTGGQKPAQQHPAKSDHNMAADAAGYSHAIEMRGTRVSSVIAAVSWASSAPLRGESA